MSPRLRLALGLFVALFAVRAAAADDEPLVPLYPGVHCLPCENSHCYDRCYTTFRIYWLDYEATRCKFILREVKCNTTCVELELDHCDEEHICTTLVLKPRRIVKQVTCCTTEPVKSVDPCTGCTTYCFVPKTEVKTVEEIVFDLCPEEKRYKVRKLFLKPVEKNYTVRKYWLDQEEVKIKEIRGTLVPCENQEVVISCPPPCSGVPESKPAKPPEAPPAPPGERILPPKSGAEAEGR